ncbi:MAG: Rpn family recombination-promoting nuclease/putative transposase [Planctomycetes bacterium]|nr:Rpn family recombination-promoting nuclease/putative transposase [Planctomycetota bacterium]
MHSPHDALFRHAFGQVAHAVPLLRAILPATLAGEFDWRTLEPVPGTMVDERLKRRQGDLIFRVRRHDGGQVLVYVLIEHKRRAERWALLQMLQYVVSLWRLHTRRDGGPLPKVLPILLVQSVEAGRQAATLAELFAGAGASTAGEVMLDAVQPQFAPIVVSLDQLSQQARRGLLLSLFGRLVVDALVSLPAMRADLLAALLRDWAPAFLRLAGRRAGGPMLDALWSYLLQVADVPVTELIVILERTMDPVLTRKFKSPAQQLLEMGREEGREAGRDQGVVEGRRALLSRLLQARFGDLPARVHAALAAADAAQLDELAVRQLDATALDQLFPA